MSFFELYILFCLATMILGVLSLIAPVLGDIRFEQPLNPVSEHPIISYLTFICIFLLAAPILLYPVIYPPAALKFKTTLHKSLTHTK